VKIKQGVSFTMYSITQAAEKLLEEIFKTNITEGLTSSIYHLYASFDEFVRTFLSSKLNELDQDIFNNPDCREGWKVVHKDVPRTIQCRFGPLSYKRRYYRHKETGVTLHLADVLAKIDKGDRIERGLALTLTELATDNSYEKSSKIACNNHVSRQSVMKKTRAAKNYELEKEPERREVKEIHIQVDEDHVAMQNGKSSIVKLAVVHEPRKQIKSKAILPNKMHFASHKDKPEDFWCKVSEGIIERYGNRDDLKVYIHGDGASWIKTGLEWIPNSVFILDRFHVHKYINKLNDFKYINQTWQYLRRENYNDLKVFLYTLVANDEIDEKTGSEIYSYLRNNREGIKNLLTLPPNTVKSCAEGLVSHVLSDRLSRKPLAWSAEGLETITQLRMYLLNGGALEEKHFVQTNPSVEKHKSKVIEMRKRLAPPAYYMNFDINKYIPRKKDNKFLKSLANIS
jgi:hypothetical protein